MVAQMVKNSVSYTRCAESSLIHIQVSFLYSVSHLVCIQSHLICIQSDLIYIQSTF